MVRRSAALARLPLRALTVVALAWAAGCAMATPALAAETERARASAPQEYAFDLPAQPATDALLAFSQVTQREVLFSFDALRSTRANAVTGTLTPDAALARLLAGTGFTARPNGSAFVVTRAAPAAGVIRGRILLPDGRGAVDVRIGARLTRHVTRTDGDGNFQLPDLAPGTYRLVASADGYDAFPFPAVEVTAGGVHALEPHTLQPSDRPSRLAPFFVHDQSTRRDPFDRSEARLGPRTAGGNLDLARTENDALPFTVYNRDQITRSGVVNLNEFLQRELLESDAAIRPPEQDGTAPSFTAGSTNLNLRGFGADQTIVLVNGRRLPEALTSYSGTLPPDVNFIPLSLVQQVEVLPISAASLYSGNAVGGIINIILRPSVDAEATELALTYTNALSGYDAPQSSASILHSRSLLNGALRVRFNASFATATPPTESELGYRQARPAPVLTPYTSLYRGTPNIRAVHTTPIDPVAPPPPPPLFGPGTPSFASVAPGADGTGGLAAVQARAGVRNFAFFDSPGGLASATDSVDYPYGREQKRAAYFGSAVYTVAPWLELSFDATYTRTVLHRGFDVMPMDLRLRTESPFNPFGVEAVVSLNEIAPDLGETYSEARLEFASGVLSALVTLPANWQLLLDGQYGRNLAKYRGLGGYDFGRWQQLVDVGLYNPLRDTQVFGPPPAFYERVLIHRGGAGRFVTLGDYSTLDGALRATNTALAGPTGRTVVNLGADYRINELGRYTDERRYADGELAAEPIRYQGRTLERYSVFGEIQAPLVPARWLPRGIRELDANLAVRYIAANQAREANVAPTFALKAGLPGGLTLRGSASTSSRYPTPQMSRLATSPTSGSIGTIGELREIYDPVQKDRYNVQQDEVLNPDLSPEAAVTQTLGAVYRRGNVHRIRASLDFVDTRKVNEVVDLQAQDIVNLEHLFPDRVVRRPAEGATSDSNGWVTTVLTGPINSEWRRSHHWNATLDYAWTQCVGGTLEAYARVLYFSRYRRLLTPGAAMVDEIDAPEGASSGLLRYRAKFGAGWSNATHGFGLDGHYFHSRILPLNERVLQGRDRISPYWQFDVYAQSDVSRWLPWTPRGVRLQVRVNNLLAAPFPRYESAGSGAGVQAYGDWRGRVYSLSLTSTF